MKDGVVRMGFIGLGHNAEAHIAAHKAHPQSRVLAVCDLSPEKARRVAARFDVPGVYSDYALLDRDDLDAISIHTPDHLHAEPFIRALEAGKHVFVEKPMADTIEDLAAMTAAARRRPDLTVLVGHILRFNPVFAGIRARIDRGELGRVFYAEADYIHNLRCQAASERYDPAIGMNWYLEREIPMVGGGCHPLDLLRWMVNEPVVSVTGYGNRIAFPEMRAQDCQVALFRFAGGAVAKVACSYGCVSPYAFMNNLTIYGTQGTVSRDRICLAPQPEEFRSLGLETVKGHPYEPEVAHFLDCILHKAPPLIGAYDGANSAAACIAAAQACEAQGLALPVPHYTA